MERFTFNSDGWLGAVEQIAQHLLDEGKAAPAPLIRYVEIFTGAPVTPNAGSVAGYVLAFADGKATVTRLKHEDEPADCVVRIDYNTALEMMKVKAGPELDAISRKAFADGLMTITGSPKILPISMNRLHDALFDQTKT